MGFFIILITILAFMAGWLRGELALLLLGTVFLIILSYCFLVVFLSGLIYRRKGQALSMVINPETVSLGNKAELCLQTKSGFPPEKNSFFRLPMVLIRCELRLGTKDGRVIRQFADPGKENNYSFQVNERGAYYSNIVSGQGDRFVISDIPGFFNISLPLKQNEDTRLLAVPAPAEEPLSLSLRSGGSEEKPEPHYHKNDDFTNHRPYIPGDDPRRINWKLYSHAPLGDLFVREGEPEHPLYSRLLILVDTEVDTSLFTVDAGRCAVDVLCEIALALALEYKARGMDIHIAYTGGRIINGNGAGEIAAALAQPFAIFQNGGSRVELPLAEMPRAEMPSAPKDTTILILALPRTFVDISALESFIKQRVEKQAADIVFFYNAETEDAAGSCVNLYNRRSGIRAAKIPAPLGLKAEEGK